MIAARKKKGFIFITILVIVSFTYFIYSRIMNTALLHAICTKSATAEEQAKQLIFAGCSMAMLKMVAFEDGVVAFAEEEEAMPGISKRTVQESSVITHDMRLKSFYAGILPILNLWQKVVLTQETDGIEAKIHFCLSCEEGKFNLNHSFDLANNDFKPGYKELFSDLKFENVKTGGGDLKKILMIFFDKHERWFDDVSQIPLSEKMECFYHPETQSSVVDGKIPEKTLDSKSAQNEQKKVAAEKESNTLPGNSSSETPFCDLFTVVTPADAINPLLLSSSAAFCLGIREGALGRQGTRFKKVVNKVVNKMSYSWSMEDNLSLLSSLYARKIENINPDDEKDLLSDPKDQNSNKDTTQSTLQSSDGKKNEDRFLVLKKFFTKNVEPEVFSLLVTVEHSDMSKSAIIMFKRQSIKDKYQKEYKNPNEKDSQIPALDKKKLENEATSEQDQKKNASLYKRCFFLPNGFEIIRFYWL